MWQYFTLGRNQNMDESQMDECRSLALAYKFILAGKNNYDKCKLVWNK